MFIISHVIPKMKSKISVGINKNNIFNCPLHRDRKRMVPFFCQVGCTPTFSWVHLRFPH